MSMDASIFINAVIIGFLIAAPVGPIGLLCIQRTLKSGVTQGLCSGLGAAAADAVYGAIAASGFVAITETLNSLITPLKLLGALLLIWLGFKSFLTRTVSNAPTQSNYLGVWSSFFSTFVLTLSNPMTIFSFMAVVASLSPSSESTATDSGLIIAGVFTGSICWWLLLVISVASIKHKLKDKLLVWVGKMAGMLLIGFALWQLVNL